MTSKTNNQKYIIDNQYTEYVFLQFHLEKIQSGHSHKTLDSLSLFKMLKNTVIHQMIWPGKRGLSTETVSFFVFKHRKTSCFLQLQIQPVLVQPPLFSIKTLVTWLQEWAWPQPPVPEDLVTWPREWAWPQPAVPEDLVTWHESGVQVCSQYQNRSSASDTKIVCVFFGCVCFSWVPNLSNGHVFCLSSSEKKTGFFVKHNHINNYIFFIFTFTQVTSKAATVIVILCVQNAF